MPDELDHLKAPLESTVSRPSFEQLTERAEAVRQRRRSRRTALAVSAATVAIVVAALGVVTLPNEQNSQIAGPTDSERAQHQKAVTVGSPDAGYTARKDGSFRPYLRGQGRVDQRGLEFVLTGFVDGENAVTYRARSGGSGEQWQVAGGSSCDGLEAGVRGRRVSLDVPVECVPAKRMQWRAQLRADGEIVRSLDFNPALRGKQPAQSGSRRLDGFGQTGGQ